MRGIPVKFHTYNDQGERSDTPRTAVFATVRRSPELLGLMTAIDKADIQSTRAMADLQRAVRAMTVCEDEAAVDGLIAAVDTANDALQTAQLHLGDTVHKFLVQGFVGAGYPTDAAEELADLVPGDAIISMRQSCVYGMGTLDFTKPQSDEG